MYLPLRSVYGALPIYDVDLARCSVVPLLMTDLTDLSGALENVTPAEARALWEALGQFVENESEAVALAESTATDAGVSPDGLDDDLVAASAVLDRMNGILAALAD